MEGDENAVLLASGLGDDTGGGLFIYGEAVERVDRLSSTGLSYSEGRLCRALWAPEGAGAAGELLIYDERGVRHYHRVDALAEPHDVIWDGRELAAVSTLTNRVLWLSEAGEPIREWRAPGDGDAWHLNGLVLDQGRLYASAFGRFERHREWAANLDHGSGIVFELETGVDVITGLACPHSPRAVDDHWLVCDSARSELLRCDRRTGAVMDRAGLNGWTRGLAVGERHLFVGESAHRLSDAPGATATIAVVDRDSLVVEDRLPLPCREVYDLLFVPREIATGVRRGFRTNASRVSEQDQLAMFARAGVEPARLWATGDPSLPRAAGSTSESTHPNRSWRTRRSSCAASCPIGDPCSSAPFSPIRFGPPTDG